MKAPLCLIEYTIGEKTRSIQKKQENGIESEIALHLDNKEYAKAAKLANRSRDTILRDAICDEGILHYHKHASGEEGRFLKGHMTFVARASAYKEMAELYGIKEDSKSQERCMQLSRALQTAYIELSRMKR